MIRNRLVEIAAIACSGCTHLDDIVVVSLSKISEPGSFVKVHCEPHTLWDGRSRTLVASR